MDKRMVLEHTHGLFITQTEFRLLPTFIPIIIIIYTILADTGIIQSSNHPITYTSTVTYIHGAIPLAFSLPFLAPLCPPFASPSTYLAPSQL